MFADPTLNNELYSSTKFETTDSIELVKNEKSFVYHLGETYLEQTSIYVTSPNKTVNVSQYNWYSVEYLNDNIYTADVITGIDCPEDIGVVGVFLYPVGTYLASKQSMFDIDYSTSNILEVLYVNDDNNTCTKIITPINDALFVNITHSATEFSLSKTNTDLLSKTLIASFSFESKFKSSMYDDQMETVNLSEADVEVQLMALPSYGQFANSNNTVRTNQYDQYTNYDKFIHEYVQYYMDKVHSFYASGKPFKVSDDPIINIIPKNLFVSRGTYSYIGREYGFYVRTVQDFEEDNYSEFIVFDIDVVKPYPGRTASMDPPSITIRPLFSGIVKYLTEWGDVVVYEGYLDPYLALANIQISGAINNLYEKNIGDSGYIASQDYGYAFCSFNFEAAGTGLDRDNLEVDFGYVKTVLGTVEFLGNVFPNTVSDTAKVGNLILSMLEISANHYLEGSRTRYGNMIKSNGIYYTNNVVFGTTNTNTMISEHGNLIKGFQTEPLDSGYVKETEVPLLFKTNAHYFTVEYAFCQKNSDINWDSVIALSVALDIYNDYTGNDIWFNSDDLVKRDSVVGSRADYYIEAPTSSNGGTIEEGVLYHTEFTKDTNGKGYSSDEAYSPLLGSYKDFYFTPNRTFSYVIETTNRANSAIDPYLKLYNSSNTLIASNDDGGATDAHGSYTHNAKIIFTLTAGQTYRIRTMCYNYDSGYYELIVRKNATLSEAVSSDNVANPTTVSNDAIWYTFSPRKTAHYSFYTTGSVDTYLTLYNQAYNQYAFDDDDGSGYNAHIDFYLFAGNTYYLKVNTYSMSSGTFDVYANMQQIIQVHTVSQSSYLYCYTDNGPNYFRITPETTNSYIFKTVLLTGDPYLELYDESMTLIALDSSSGGNGDALINCTLQGGKTYYLKVRSWPPASGIGYLDCLDN